MTINGTQLAKDIKEDVKKRVLEAKQKYGREPHLVVILVGEDPASQSYVKGKSRDAEEVGFKNTTLYKPEDTPEEEILDIIRALNADDNVDLIDILRQRLG